jgi:hypothetical protein
MKSGKSAVTLLAVAVPGDAPHTQRRCAARVKLRVAGDGGG